MKQDKKEETINSFHIEQGSNKVEILNFLPFGRSKKKKRENTILNNNLCYKMVGSGREKGECLCRCRQYLYI